MHSHQEKETSQKRLFVAYMLSQEFQEAIREWENDVVTLPVRWNHLSNLHITIIPPWYEVQAQKVINMLRRPIPISSFSLEFTEIGPGPTPHVPRLLWTTTEAPFQLTQLRIFLQDKLNITPEKRPFIPHVTLGKLFTQIHAPSLIPPFHSTFRWKEKITQIQLVQSFLHPTGATYQTLLSIPLA